MQTNLARQCIFERSAGACRASSLTYPHARFRYDTIVKVAVDAWLRSRQNSLQMTEKCLMEMLDHYGLHAAVVTKSASCSPSALKWPDKDR
jgi:hypothetical protein